jgi:sugar phosphate isomerase/epimerase
MNGGSRLKIGFASTSVWRFSPVAAVFFAKELGVCSFELWADHYFMNSDSTGEIRKACREAGILPTVHAASWDLNITSISKEVRRFSMEQVQRSIDLAHEIGAQVITIHPGRKSFVREDRRDVSEMQRGAFHELFVYGRQRDVTILIENIEETGKEVMVNEKDFIDFLSGNNDELFITMDVAHLGDVKKVVSFYTALRDRIRHIHISDLSPHEIHIPMGEGILNTREIISFLKATYNGIFCLEVYWNDEKGEGLKKSIQYLRKISGLVGYA